MPSGSSRSPRRSTPPAASSADLPSEAPPGEPRPDIASLLADFASAQDAKFAAFGEKRKDEHKRLRTDFKADMAAFISPLDKGYRKRFDRLEVEQADVRSEVRALQSKMEQMSARVAGLGDNLQKAEAVLPPALAIDDDDFHRAPVDSIVRIRTQAGSTSEGLLAPFKQILSEMRIAEDAFSWDAQPLGRAGTALHGRPGACSTSRPKVHLFAQRTRRPLAQFLRHDGHRRSDRRVR